MMTNRELIGRLESQNRLMLAISQEVYLCDMNIQDRDHIASNINQIRLNNKTIIKELEK